MTRPETSIGEALIGLLESYGVDTIFGIPGVHNVEMYRALPRSNITHILPRHEQGAGFMADGYARATGRPGICFTITGPGLTNILTPMGQAYSDSVPLLVISSCLDITDNAHGRGRLHEMRDQRAAAATVSATARTAFSARDVQDAIASAFTSFATERPRPHYLEIPIDVLLSPAGDDGWQPRKIPTPPHAATDQIIKAATWLNKAATPVILAGGGAIDCTEALTAVAEASGAMVFSTIAGKGILPDHHPLNSGAVLPNPQASAFLQKADVVLAVGSEISETDLWYQDFSITGKLIRIDIDPQSLARPFAADLPILSDANNALSTLTEHLTKSSRNRIAEVRQLRENLPREDDELRATLRKVLGVIRDTLPVDTHVVSDMTQIAYAGNEIFPCDQPRLWLHPIGFGTLGYALPAAIGARAANMKRPVAVLAGDYGLQYTINELGTACELKAPLVILLWNNNALGQIRDDMVMKAIQPNAVSLVNPDFLHLASAYGCATARPESLPDLSAAISTALKADRPSLIEITPTMVRD